ncbi:MAG: hypothetical protein WC955_08855 [Elusimicrobiota bacterium]
MKYKRKDLFRIFLVTAFIALVTQQTSAIPPNKPGDLQFFGSEYFDLFGNSFGNLGTAWYFIDENSNLEPTGLTGFSSIDNAWTWKPAWEGGGGGLIELKDKMSNWNTVFSIGRTNATGEYYKSKYVKFTPNTLELTQMHGIKWEVMSPGGGMSLVASRTSEPVGVAAGADSPRQTYLFAGRITRKVTSKLIDLSAGLSYVNQHKDTSKIYQTTMQGSLDQFDSYYTPSYIQLKFRDDSPEDMGGAVVYKIAVYINGQRIDQMTVEGGVPGEEIDRYQADKNIIDLNSVTRFYKQANLESKSVQYYYSDGYPERREANGDAYFAYKFDFTKLSTEAGYEGTIRNIVFKITMANDTKIEMDYGNGFFQVYNTPGNVKDYSNKGILTYKFGRPVANEIYGLDLNGTVLKDNPFEFTVNAEIDLNRKYYMYPNESGERSVEGRALSPKEEGQRDEFQKQIDELGHFIGFLNLNKKMLKKSLNVGFEYYYTDPDYNYWSEYNVMGPSFEDYPTTDDNDDNDKNYEVPNKAGGINGFSRFYDRDVDLKYTYYTRTATLDWLQDNLMFEYDPPTFWVGEDRNNNFIVDDREDDQNPDYSYVLDMQGYHLFTNYKLKDLKNRLLKNESSSLSEMLTNSEITIGQEQRNGISNSLYAYNTYFRFNYRYDINNFGRVLFDEETKRVQDTIPDNYVRYDPDPANPKFNIYDPLDYEDSIYNFISLQTDFTAIKSFLFSSKFLYRDNSKLQANRQREQGLWLKGRYEFKLPRLVQGAPVKNQDLLMKTVKGVDDFLQKWNFIPRYKFLSVKKWDEPTGVGYPYLTDYFYHMYIIESRYKLFENTFITAGINYLDYRDMMNNANNYYRSEYLAQIVGDSGRFKVYAGYKYRQDDNYNLVEDPVKFGYPKYERQEQFFVRVWLRY